MVVEFDDFENEVKKLLSSDRSLYIEDENKTPQKGKRPLTISLRDSIYSNYDGDETSKSFITYNGDENPDFVNIP
jgi:hypothetical protein